MRPDGSRLCSRVVLQSGGMKSGVISRREAVVAAAALATLTRSNSQTTLKDLSASEVVDRIKAHVGVPWKTETVDQLVGGAPDTQVTGIATTMMATLDVLKRAAGAGFNMVITHETPFYLHQDKTADLANDPTLQYKLDFLRDHKMAVFHFHDHWHARKPDGIATGMAQELGWTGHADPQDPRRFTFADVSLEQIADHIKTKLGASTMRVIGNRKLRVKSALASWGYVSRMPGIEQFRQPGLNLLIGGETREWELVEYVQDAIEKGDQKALILIGHIASEQAGMKFCAEWLRGFVTEAPVRFIAAAEPFWTPGQ